MMGQYFVVTDDYETRAIASGICIRGSFGELAYGQGNHEGADERAVRAIYRCCQFNNCLSRCETPTQRPPQNPGSGLSNPGFKEE